MTSSSHSRTMATSSHSRPLSRSHSLTRSSHSLSRSRSPATRFGYMHDGRPSHSRPGSTDQKRTIKVVGDVEYMVRTTVTSSGMTVKRFLQEVHGEEPKPLLVGLDTEWYQVEGRSKTALVQLCVGKQCLLFQTCRANGIPDDLKRFLAHEGHVFVGVAIANDFDRLWEDHQIKLSKTVELQAMVPFVIKKGKWHKVPNLATLAQEVLGVAVENKDTNVRKRNWNRQYLTEDQIKYACIDAFLPYMIGDLLQSKYGCDLPVSPSPIPDGSTDNNEDEGARWKPLQTTRKGGQRKPLHFVENQTTRKIAICPGCLDKKRVTRTWDQALTHAVYQVSKSNSSEEKKSCHKRLLRTHGFRAESDDSGSEPESY